MEMASEGFKLPTERFEGLPEHERLAVKITDRLKADDRVLGVYLSGSFAKGKPDRYSDLDFYIVVPEGTKEAVVAAHKSIFEEVGKVGTIFPANHLGDPNQIIAFYEEGLPIHVDYNYKVPSELRNRAKDKDAVILIDKEGELAKLKESWQSLNPEEDPTVEALQYFEDRFWAWCWYTYSKIQRGELWESRDATEYLRNSVLIKLAHYQAKLAYEGNRRLETKFAPGVLRTLEDTLPEAHSQQGYLQTLIKLMNGYKQLFQDAVSANGLQGIKEVDRDFFEQSILVGY